MSTATAATAAPATTERSPHAVDSPVGAATRAGVELVAWIAAPWALASWSWAAAVLLLVVLVALPATFNVPGDKRHAGHPVSGQVRIGIELLLTGAAVLGAWLAWPTWAGGSGRSARRGVPRAGAAALDDGCCARPPPPGRPSHPAGRVPGTATDLVPGREPVHCGPRRHRHLPRLRRQRSPPAEAAHRSSRIVAPSHRRRRRTPSRAHGPALTSGKPPHCRVAVRSRSHVSATSHHLEEHDDAGPPCRLVLPAAPSRPRPLDRRAGRRVRPRRSVRRRVQAELPAARVGLRGRLGHPHHQLPGAGRRHHPGRRPLRRRRHVTGGQVAGGAGLRRRRPGRPRRRRHQPVLAGRGRPGVRGRHHRLRRGRPGPEGQRVHGAAGEGTGRPGARRRRRHPAGRGRRSGRQAVPGGAGRRRRPSGCSRPSSSCCSPSGPRSRWVCRC